MSTISASTTSTTAYKVTADTTGTLVLQTGASPTTAVTIGSDQSFNFSATGQRITGDFSNATFANRVMFQTSTVNGSTSVSAIPNGTGPIGQFQAYGGSDPANTSRLTLAADTANSRCYIGADSLGTGTFLPMTFYTGGSERMRIDTSGNVGIGITPIASNVRLSSSADATVNTAFAARSYGINCNINASAAGGTQASPSASTTSTAMLNLVGGCTYDGTNYINAASMIFGLEATPTSSSTPSYVTFSTVPSGSTSRAERMRIDSSGNVGIGAAPASDVKLDVLQTSSFAARFYVGSCTKSGTVSIGNSFSGDSRPLYIENSSTSSTTNGMLFINNFTAAGSGFQFIQCFSSNSTSQRMYVSGNGGIANYQANNVNLSDRREKTDFSPATNYLEKICAIPVQTFKYIDQEESDTELTLGVVAQDVQAVAPELVHESNWGSKENPRMRLAIYQTDLQYALMKAIQEQQAIIQQLTARIETLEAK